MIIKLIFKKIIGIGKIMKGAIFQQIIIKQNGLKANVKKKSE